MTTIDRELSRKIHGNILMSSYYPWYITMLSRTPWSQKFLTYEARFQSVDAVNRVTTTLYRKMKRPLNTPRTNE